MPLSAGDKLGPYEILSPLGAGGMGEVYKARDTRLDRSVAIKVLPEHIAQREDLRQRFEREARAVASLNHPHICVLHDIGSQNGTGYMVMECLEGETLAARIEKGPIPLEKSLDYAVQIADALDRAHRAGVTHRDLKPGNIMLTRDGVKLLDFGLAKSTTKPAPSEATLTKVLTAEGTVVGTPQYMAPEQFEGKEADARSDIWAFGAVLYEMVTGRRAFQGKSYSSLVGAILASEPPPMSVKPFTPSWLERLVRRCLAKDPEDRYQSVRDVLLDLKAPPVDSLPAKPSRWPWAVAIACLIAAFVLGWTARRQPSAEPAGPVALEVSPPDGGGFHRGLGSINGSAISPDGQTLAFVAVTAGGETLLHVRRLESLEVRALPGTGNASRPFWSPDGKSLGFVADAKLKRIDVAGGPPVTLCDVATARGGTWNEDNVILFGGPATGVQRIHASGGPVSMVTAKPVIRGESHYYPQFLPGGRQFLYLVLYLFDPEKSEIYAGSLDGAPATRIVQTAYNAYYDSHSKRLLYIQGAGTLMARRMELDPPRLTGEPVVVAERVGTFANNGFAGFSVSGTGTLLYHRGGGEGELRRFAWWDRAGKTIEAMGQPFESGITDFRISPDGSKIAHTAGPSNRSDIWVFDLTRRLSSRFTFGGGGIMPRWSPDGKYIYYLKPGEFRRKAADGSGEEERVAESTAVGLIRDFGGGVSPDGRFLIWGGGANPDIWKLSLIGEKKAEPWLQTNHRKTAPALSPDGRWIAYQSDESGRPEVYVQAFSERGGKWLVSTDSGRYPKWRSDGKELYWISLSGEVMAVSVALQTGVVQTGNPERLFQLPSAPIFQPFGTDGHRFLVLEQEGGGRSASRLVVVQNWAARLAK